MSSNPDRPVEVHVCYSDTTDDQYPHWLLSLSVRGTTTCTWIHSTGGPSQHRDYERSIQRNKSLDSPGIASSSFQGTISARDVDRVIEVAKGIEPQQCQMYVVAVVATLEKEGLLPEGRTTFLKDQVMMSQRSIDYRQSHPVAKPAVAYSKRDHDDFYGPG